MPSIACRHCQHARIPCNASAARHLTHNIDLSCVYSLDRACLCTILRTLLVSLSMPARLSLDAAMAAIGDAYSLTVTGHGHIALPCWCSDWPGLAVIETTHAGGIIATCSDWHMLRVPHWCGQAPAAPAEPQGKSRRRSWFGGSSKRSGSGGDLRQPADRYLAALISSALSPQTAMHHLHPELCALHARLMKKAQQSDMLVRGPPLAGKSSCAQSAVLIGACAAAAKRLACRDPAHQDTSPSAHRNMPPALFQPSPGPPLLE